MVELDKKKELILQGAIKRFCHFGINKTSMAEIADDLSVSKPALYYYYPDKQSLILAVTENISSSYLENVEQIFLEVSDLGDALMSLIDLRRRFFEKYFMLHMEEEYSDAYLKDKGFVQLIHKIKDREKTIIAASFQKGIALGEIGDIDPVKTAELLLDTLKGFRACMRSEKMIFPDADTFELAFCKMKEVACIFLNGIKRHS